MWLMIERALRSGVWAGRFFWNVAKKSRFLDACTFIIDYSEIGRGTDQRGSVWMSQNSVRRPLRVGELDCCASRFEGGL
jgi:hypothetical protein